MLRKNRVMDRDLKENAVGGGFFHAFLYKNVINTKTLFLVVFFKR